jgi:hypothetical protein
MYDAAPTPEQEQMQDFLIGMENFLTLGMANNATTVMNSTRQPKHR